MEDFEGDVIRVVMFSRAFSGKFFGSSTMIVRVKGDSFTTNGKGIESTDRIFKSGGRPLAFAVAASLTPSPATTRHHNVRARPMIGT
jgi:hypothetical protein